MTLPLPAPVVAGRRLALLLLLAAAGLPIYLPVAPPLTRDAVVEQEGEDSASRRDAASAAKLLEHFARFHQLERWHHSGFRGKGIKVAVLDSGFRGYKAHLGKALPERVTARSFRMDGNLEAKDSQHGILCGEVIHALAPDAELLFANWEPDRPEQFINAVRWARHQGAQVLSCSVIMPTWSDGEGGGAVHEALRRVVGSGNDRGDQLFFVCAGNTAQRHWSGPYQDAGQGYHAWTPGKVDNAVKPWGGERVSVEVYTAPGAEYELIVEEQAAGVTEHQPLAQSRTERGVAVVRYDPEPGYSYRTRIRLTRGKAQPFHIVALGGTLEHFTARGSIPFPGDGPEVIAVGAVDPEGRRTSYSCCGPNSSKPKPDFMAPVPFPSSWRSRPFSGTSAAAPQAAALAAILWSRHPDWNSGRVRATLERSARDLGPAGHDYETGYGLVNLPRDWAE